MKFCGECGAALTTTTVPSKTSNLQDERKLVTVMFADISGFTAMSEKMDPEQVRDLMNACFEQLVPVITKYGGTVDKFIGDEIMALFGVPVAHEDDPERALRAALEMMDALSEFNAMHNTDLGIHFGINTGLVVAGILGTTEQQDYSVMGDTVNLASRLEELSERGQILVGHDTYHATNHLFEFQQFGPIQVKGKAVPVQVFKVLSVKGKPSMTRRPSGLRANLIGRKSELAQLTEGVKRLREGEGTIFSICGDAGMGKSRLVEEFQATLDLAEVQWLECHAFPYSQNIPYFPLSDLFNRAWQIEEGDSPEMVKENIESNIERLLGKKEDVAPYVGSLYGLDYPQVEDPEFWKSRFIEGVQAIFAALAHRAPTVICFEDLHWADPSSIDLLRFILPEFRYPVLFLCVYRPTFSLFTLQQQSEIGELYQEIQLKDLSPSETEEMIESLLNIRNIPPELREFIQEKAEGNPFYLEETINSLIESEILTRDNGGTDGIGMFHWRLTKPIGESDVPTTIQGVISARVDRLEKEMKRILQEASVIGRFFLYDILKRITELKDHIDQCLNGLEEIDLIRPRSLQPEVEYIFKHVLTHEVVYNGLLKKERQVLHERTGLVIEQLFHDRISEFYETLAFHFKQSQSLHKAVDYLVKSGEKSLDRYAVEEAHQYFKEAFDILSSKQDRTTEEDGLLIDVLNKWAEIFHYRGDARGLTDLLSAHEQLAESLSDKARLGMFYAWRGYTLYLTGNFRDSYQYLLKALEFGEEIDNHQVIGHACDYLTWTCAELGLLDEAIAHGERAQEISILKSDQYLYFKSLAGIACAYYYKGEKKKILEAGKSLLNYGRIHSNLRCLAFGHMAMAFSHLAAGGFSSAIDCFQRGIQISADPLHSMLLKLFLGFGYVLNDQFQEAEDTLQEVLTFSQNFGVDLIETSVHGVLGFVLIAKGHLSRGLKMLKDAQQAFLENGSKGLYAILECGLGKVYLQIVQKAAPISLSIVAKNIGFLVKNVPFASKKAEKHFKKVIEVSEEIGAKGWLGMAYLDLGLLHKAKRKKDKARECISTAIQYFEQCEAEIYLKQAKDALASLG